MRGQFNTWFGTVYWDGCKINLVDDADARVCTEVDVGCQIVDAISTHLYIGVFTHNGVLTTFRFDDPSTMHLLRDVGKENTRETRSVEYRKLPNDLEKEEYRERSTSGALFATDNNMYFIDRSSQFSRIYHIHSDQSAEDDQSVTLLPLPWPTTIKSAATGHDFCALLDTCGNVFTFGTGIRGELGTGVTRKQENPTHLESLADVDVESLTCGGWNCFARTEDNEIYTWGWTPDGTFGEKSASFEPYPVLVDGNRLIEAKSIVTREIYRNYLKY